LGGEGEEEVQEKARVTGMEERGKRMKKHDQLEFNGK
jgi:hypothetical protein